MVGPPSGADRERHRRLVAVGLVGVVGLSAGMSGLYSGASLLETGLLALAGAVTGGALVLVLGSWP
jgi:hypothetical protein